MTDHNPMRHGREFREQRLAEYGEQSFPETLVIEVETGNAIEELREMVDRAEARTGEDVDVDPARISLDAEKLRQLLTARRLELIESIMADPAASIKALAERVDRTYPAVHDDLDLLADHGVVVFKREGRANRPVIPYDRIEYSGVISRNEAPA